MLSELIPEEKRKLHELEQKINDLDRGNLKWSPPDLVAEYEQITLRINELDKMAQKETKQKRDDFRRRISHLRNTQSHLMSSLEKHVRRSGNSYLLQRSLLMSGGNGDVPPENVDLELAENGALTRSSNMVSNYIAMGRESLSELTSQKERLKTLQRKALDIFNYLGLSNSLMKGVESRDKVDKWIVYIGMIVVLVIIFICWRYFRK